MNRAGASLIVAIADPSNIFAVDEVKFITGYNIEVVVAAEASIRDAIEKYYTVVAAEDEEDALGGMDFDSIMDDFADEDIEVTELEDLGGGIDLAKAAEDAPVVKLCNLILVDAIKKGASDIHIEPYSIRVRYRIDGSLYEVMRPPLNLKMPLPPV